MAYLDLKLLEFVPFLCLHIVLELHQIEVICKH